MLSSEACGPSAESGASSANDGTNMKRRSGGCKDCVRATPGYGATGVCPKLLRGMTGLGIDALADRGGVGLGNGRSTQDLRIKSHLLYRLLQYA